MDTMRREALVTYERKRYWLAQVFDRLGHGSRTKAARTLGLDKQNISDLLGQRVINPAWLQALETWATTEAQDVALDLPALIASPDEEQFLAYARKRQDLVQRFNQQPYGYRSLVAYSLRVSPSRISGVLRGRLWDEKLLTRLERWLHDSTAPPRDHTESEPYEQSRTPSSRLVSA